MKRLALGGGLTVKWDRHSRIPAEQKEWKGDGEY